MATWQRSECELLWVQLSVGTHNMHKMCHDGQVRIADLGCQGIKGERHLTWMTILSRLPWLCKRLVFVVLLIKARTYSTPNLHRLWLHDDAWECWAYSIAMFFIDLKMIWLSIRQVISNNRIINYYLPRNVGTHTRHITFEEVALWRKAIRTIMRVVSAQTKLTNTWN